MKIELQIPNEMQKQLSDICGDLPVSTNEVAMFALDSFLKSCDDPLVFDSLMKRQITLPKDSHHR